MINGDGTKVLLSMDDEMICEINKASSALNMSMGDAVRFMIKHYLKFEITGVKTERFELDDRDTEKDNLIETLKTNIAEKEMVINYLASEVVIISKRVNDANNILGKMEDLIQCSER